VNVRARAAGVTLATLAIAMAFGGCTGSGSPNPRPSIVCEVAEILLVQAFPIPGASGVPVTTPSLVFAIPQSASPSGYQLQLLANGQTRLGSVLGAPPSPLPSPIATPPPNYVYAGASPPPLQASTNYTAELLTPLTCLGPETTGTFSTQ
jgi:hypothetical protein